MPVYEYHCRKCDRDVTLTLTISQYEKGKIECPKCGSKALRRVRVDADGSVSRAARHRS